MSLLPLPLPEPAPETLTVAHAIVDTLAAHGVDSLFGIPGGAISPLYDVVADRPALRLVTTRHETAAVFAAMGYARITGRPAVVVVTSGPGFTNALTGLAAAHGEQLPVLLIAGDVASQNLGRFALQDGAALDVLSLARPVTRFRARIDRPSAATALIVRALAEATGPTPGPVVLTLPLDVSRAATSASRIVSDTRAAPASPPRAECVEIARLLRGARRPLLIAGAGARDAGSALVAIAERTGAMAVATGHAKGAFPEHHRNYLGVLGFGGHKGALAYAREADVTVVFGSRLGDITTNGWSDELAPSSALVQIDRDPSVLGRNYPLHLGLVADVALAAEAIARECAGPTTAPRAPALELDERERNDATSPLKPQFVLAALQRALPPSTIFTVDIGEHAAFAVHHLRVESADRFHMNASLGSMGSGLGAAIGIKVARPDAPVVAIVGDGGLAMHAGELLTCAESEIAVLFVVFNDGRYRMCDLGFDDVYGRRPSGLPSAPADLAAVASACGVVGVRVDRASELATARLESLLALRRPVLLDVRIDTRQQLSLATRTASIKHFAARGRR